MKPHLKGYNERPLGFQATKGYANLKAYGTVKDGFRTENLILQDPFNKKARKMKVEEAVKEWAALQIEAANPGRKIDRSTIVCFIEKGQAEEIYGQASVNASTIIMTGRVRPRGRTYWFEREIEEDPISLLVEIVKASGGEVTS